MRLTPGVAPWAFARGDPFSTISSSELLGSLVALKPFVPKSKRGIRIVSLGGATDNQGNEQLLYKLMSTKYPLNCCLAELAAEMEHRQVHLKLKWLRRDLPRGRRSDERSFQQI